MCTPTIALAATGAGLASSTVGAYYAAQSQKDALNLRADLNERTAQQVLQAGQREEQRSRLATARLKGSQRAGMAANGVDLGVGTAADILTSTDLLGEVDAQTIRSNAVRNAWGYRSEATMQRASADSVSPGMSALTTLIGGSGQVAEGWYRLNKSGAMGQPAAKAGGEWNPGQFGVGY